MNVSVERLSPMTVRYWKCQPYASFLKSISHVQVAEELINLSLRWVQNSRLVGVLMHALEALLALILRK
jgi:hypothetical protein